METSDLFKKVIFHYLEGQPRGAQKDLALSAGLDVKHLNNFLKDRRSMVEQDRTKIAKVLGMTYLEALNFGHTLITGKKPTLPKPPVNEVSGPQVSAKLKSLTQEDLALVDALVERLTAKGSKSVL